MPTSLTQKIDFPSNAPIKSLTIPTGLFINGEFVEGVDGHTFDVVNPSTGKNIVSVCEAREADVDKAVKAARKAFNESWGRKVPGSERGKMLIALAEKIEANLDALSALEALDNGKAFKFARGFDLPSAAANFRYMGGYADKNHGKTIEVHEGKHAYTQHEPIGVVGQIIPWNFPALMLSWKLGPALAMGNTVVLKTAEQTPLCALKICEYIKEIFPPGVVNILSGYGKTCGMYIAKHMDVDKVAFTGSTAVGREILKNAAESNLKVTTLELGGKSPNIVFEDADLDEAVSWSVFGIMFNHGQCCCAGSRVFVHEKLYDQFLEKAVQKIKTSIKVGDPFDESTFNGPQVSQTQMDRIQGYIKVGKESGAKLVTGGERHGSEGYFLQPTIFTDAHPKSKIVQEEIFGPVVVITKFKNEEELIKMANDTVYGLAAAVFSKNINRCIKVANALQAGTVWVNCYNQLDPQVPFGGYKSSGIGRELGEYALANYTQVKAVHVNIGQPAPI